MRTSASFKGENRTYTQKSAFFNPVASNSCSRRFFGGVGRLVNLADLKNTELLLWLVLQGSSELVGIDNDA
jgi:hypothetical protein